MTEAATLPKPPAALDEVTPQWLTASLQAEYPGVEVTAVTIDGLMGYKPNKSRIRLTYNAAGQAAGLPPTMIVKGGFNRDGSGRSGLDIGTELEILGYRDVRPLLPIVMPRCFSAVWDATSYDGALLIEDLEPKGAQFLFRAESLTYDQAAGFIDAMARFFAPMWDSAEFREGGAYGPGSEAGARRARLHELYLDKLAQPEIWDQHIDLPRGFALPRALRDRERVARAWAALREKLEAAPMVFVHGDEHLGNLYVQADGTPGFIDVCMRPEPWPMGITYFLCSTLDLLDRRAWEEKLIRHFVERLAAHGAAAPSFEEAWLLHRCTTIYPMMTWLNNSGKWQPEAVNTRNTVRAAMAAIDHDALGLLGV